VPLGKKDITIIIIPWGELIFSNASSAMLILLLHLLGFAAGPDTDPYPRNPSVNIIHYTFRLELNDTTDVIAGRAEVNVLFNQPVSEFGLNLTSKRADGKGMTVFSVTSSGNPVAFKHDSSTLWISTPLSFPAQDTVTFSIAYGGEPADGLVIGENKFGDRTFFGDNWPDRGRNWLPTLDHPYDKATVDFVIIAPDHYEVVATGALKSTKQVDGKRKEHHWHESKDVAVKVMTFGAAEFAVQQSGTVGDIPVTTWVFPQNAEAGFKDFDVGPQVLKVLQDYIGPYPYEKLAHVQSKTRFGGLENASNIFYFENSVTGNKEREGLIAHETAHQWFGNSVTENDWHHVWLSEGFATYFAALYLGTVHGGQQLSEEMDQSRRAVVKFYEKHQAPVIDTTITNIDQVLNTNTYQKAAWFLHMLRAKVGAESFKKGVQAYYSTYRDSNASTHDFLVEMEKSSGLDLHDFFDAWLYQPGHPRLSGSWTYDSKRKRVKIDFAVTGFAPPEGTMLEILIKLGDGQERTVLYPLDVMPKGGMTIEAGEKPVSIIMDPNTILLFEGEMAKKP
jgi:aminopeptidase N